MTKSLLKPILIVSSVLAAFLLFTLLAYGISYKDDILRWLALCGVVEHHIFSGYIATAKAGYTHLYLLRILLGYGCACYGVYKVAAQYIWPKREVCGKWMRAIITRVRYLSSAGVESQAALSLRWTASTFLSLVLLEGMLRLMGMYQTYTESIGQGYMSYFDQITANHYNTYRPNDTFTLDHKDFRYYYKSNELGQRERPLYGFCDSTAFKIIALGDSYTEGVGTSYDSSWPQSLRRKLATIDRSPVLYDGGQSGADPFFEYALLHDRLMQCRPDIVMVALNTSDISDYFFRGGMERFHHDGRVYYRHGPWYERLYASSRVLRFISITIFRQKPQMFISDKGYEAYENAFVKDTRGVLIRMAQEARPAKLLVMIHPGPTDCESPSHDDVRHSYQVLSDVIQGMDKYGVYTIDLYPPLDKAINQGNVMQYTFAHDKHYNGAGYQIFADAVWSETQKKYPGFFNKGK